MDLYCLELSNKLINPILYLLVSYEVMTY